MMERELRYAVNWRIDDDGLRFIADREAEGGAILHAYDDNDPQHRLIKPGDKVYGTLTIGYGHTHTVKPGMRITDKEAIDLLRSDVREAESYVHRFVRVPITQWQYNALVSIIFNVGPGRLPGANGADDKGKSGIIVLTTGQPSSLLASLNDGKYDVAATWFTAWKATKGFEFGLFRRRIAEMLMFMGLPWLRAFLACNSLQFTMAEAIRLGKEELADIRGMQPAAPAPTVTVITDTPRIDVPRPELPNLSRESPHAIPVQLPLPGEDELVLTEEAAAPIATEANEAAPEKPPSPAPGRASPEISNTGSSKPASPVPVPTAPPSPPGPVSPLPPPKPPVVIAPKTIDINTIPYGEIDAANGAKNMSESKRVIGMVVVGIGSVIQVVTTRLGVGTAIGAVTFDLSRDPVVVALFVGAIVGVIAFITRKRGTKIVTKGMVEARQVLK